MTMKYARQEFGESGIKIVNDSALHEGSFCRLQTLSEVVIDTITGSQDGLNGATLPAGITLYFPFSAIQLTSGQAILTRAG